MINCMQSKRILKGLHVLAAVGFLGLASFFRVTPIVGSWASFFSAKTFLVPLVGAFAGVWGSFLCAGLRLIVRLFFGAAVPATLLAHIFPGLGASLSWATRSFFVHVLLPLVCFLLFVVHPVGGLAWCYAAYWFIPPVAWLFFTRERKSVGAVFVQALSSTFIAHAIGSVIWLYTIPLSAHVWRALIPIVAAERLVFAGALSLSYYAGSLLLRVLREKFLWGFIGGAQRFVRLK